MDEKIAHYNDDDIQVLEGLEAVRKRPGMYIGTTSEKGLHHLVWEIVDNAIDEALAGYCDDIEVVIGKGNVITVKDDGRGMPTGINKKTGLSTIETIFTVLHAGGKFGGGGYKVSGGLHGVGASVVNALSSWLDVTVYHDGKVFYQKFENGGHPVEELKEIGTCEENRTGTTVSFKAYPEVFTDSTEISARSTLVVRCVLSMDAFCERLKELNPNLNITRESSQRYMPYLCYWSPESGEKDKSLAEEKRKFEEKMTNPDRMLASLFSDPEFVRKNVNPHEFMWGLYYLASGMQDIETDLSFYDIFTPDELFDL